MEKGKCGLGFGREKYKPIDTGYRYIVELEEIARGNSNRSTALEDAKADALYLKRKTGRNHIVLRMIGVVK